MGAFLFGAAAARYRGHDGSRASEPGRRNAVDDWFQGEEMGEVGTVETHQSREAQGIAEVGTRVEASRIEGNRDGLCTQPASRGEVGRREVGDNRDLDAGRDKGLNQRATKAQDVPAGIGDEHDPVHIGHGTDGDVVGARAGGELMTTFPGRRGPSSRLVAALGWARKIAHRCPGASREPQRPSAGPSSHGAVLRGRPALAVQASVPAHLSNGAQWTATGGLSFAEPGLVLGEAPGWQRAVRESGRLKLSLRVRTYDPYQAGPARIMTLSRDTWSQNLLVGQEGSDLIVRLAVACGQFVHRRCIRSLRAPNVFAGEDWMDLTLEVGSRRQR